MRNLNMDIVSLTNKLNTANSAARAFEIAEEINQKQQLIGKG